MRDIRESFISELEDDTIYNEEIEHANQSDRVLPSNEDPDDVVLTNPPEGRFYWDRFYWS